MSNRPSKRAAVYLRVSTAEQSVSTQEHAVKRYCELQGWAIVEVFRDEGVSGSADHRPALDRLKEEIACDRFDVVVVWKFDRLARSTGHLLECLELFRRHGADFVSVTESIDTSSHMGRMVFSFLAAIAEFERGLIRERVTAGLRRAQAEGKHCGRPRKEFDLVEAVRLRKMGLGYKRISAAMGIPKSTVQRHLSGGPKPSLEMATDV